MENFPSLLEKFHFSGFFFHSSGLPSVPKFSPNEEIGKFSTLVENSPLPKICKKKNFFCRIAWIGTFCRGRKFSTFGGKFSTLVKFYFRHLDLRVCQISSPKEKLEFFPLWWKIFHLQKCAPKKKKFFAELHELEHSAEGTFFRKIGNFSTFSTNSKIPKIYLSGPISVQSFSKKYFLKKSGIQAVGFWAKISNFQTWNRIYSEIFPLFH